MKEYLDLLKDVLEHGNDRMDRTNTGTRAVFGRQLRFDLSKGFPAVTTKKLAWKAMVSELLWFIEGSGDERRLREILHGDRNSDKMTIWTDNAEAGYWKEKAKFDGDLGRVYGVQWREWRGRTFSLDAPEFLKKRLALGLNDWDDYNSVSQTDRVLCHYTNPQTFKPAFMMQEITDQLANLIHGIKNDPYGRRHILSAWNPGELQDMALPPCHAFAQFFVADGKLSCQMYQRSVDTFLGLPFNISSYSLFTHMLAQVCGLEVGEFVWVGGDIHIYSNHMLQVQEQLTRIPDTLPKLWINPDVKNIEDFTMEDFKLENYKPQQTIKAPMAV